MHDVLIVIVMEKTLMFENCGCSKIVVVFGVDCCSNQHDATPRLSPFGQSVRVRAIVITAKFESRHTIEKFKYYSAFRHDTTTGGNCRPTDLPRRRH